MIIIKKYFNYRLKNLYKISSTIRLKKLFKYNNVMCIPKINKIVINISSNLLLADNKYLNNIYKNLFLISGQKPIIIKAKKSISNFKLKKDTIIGIKVTLRNNLMYNFLDKIINIILPRMKDFRGLYYKKFNNSGIFSFNINESLIFPEILDNIKWGIDITLITSCHKIPEIKFLLQSLNLPFIL